MKPLKFCAATLVIILPVFSGCASLPDADIRYHLSQTEVAFKVVRTIACDKGNHILAASSITPVVTHFADTSSEGTKSISLAKLRGNFSDTSMKLEYYDDGRLKSFNSSNTGQGEAILKTAIAITGAVLAFDGSPATFPNECAAIKKIGGDKPIVLSYFGKIDPSKDDAQVIAPDKITAILVGVNKLEPAIGYVCAEKIETQAPTAKSTFVLDKNDVVLHLREPGKIKIKLSAGGNNSCQNETIWEDVVTVAQFGLDYDLPIPTPKLFGKLAVGASFAESGALTTIEFASATGAGQALNVGSVAYSELSDTPAEKAAALESEADLIAQQQRLVKCMAEPAQCE